MKLFEEAENLSQSSKGRELLAEVRFKARENTKSNEKTIFKKCDVTKCFYEYPLKLMFPSHVSIEEHPCQWVYPVVFGGGLLGGDHVAIESDIGDNCSVLFTSQSFPKVYSNGDRGESIQNLKFRLGSNSLLAVLSDPLVCYGQAIFRQEQEVKMERDSNLVYLDWFTAGRTARGERWAFNSLHTSLQVYLKDDLLLSESMELDNSPDLKLEDSMGSFNVIGVCIIIGPQLLSFAQDLNTQQNDRKMKGPDVTSESLITSSPLTIRNVEDKQVVMLGCVLRIAAHSTNEAYRELDRLLDPIQHLFGGRAFENKY